MATARFSIERYLAEVAALYGAVLNAGERREPKINAGTFELRLARLKSATFLRSWF